MPEADIFLYGQPNGAVIKYGENTLMVFKLNCQWHFEIRKLEIIERME
ncbi:hypothetical protein F3D3_2246 [Fusibacter sp. 3D3]|nr:hypothetical protein F3D3_2246 [Fusibacter sp. 3D3]